MKLTIWQQFSSNHSGFFWIVGRFETVPDAQAAYNELREILFDIDKWHRDNPEAIQEAWQSGNYKSLPPEQTYATKYQVEWPHTIDWTSWASYGYYSDADAQQNSAKLIDAAIRTVGCNVFVSNPHQTWMTVEPFQGILGSLGAETVGYDLDIVESEKIEDIKFRVVFSFSAPDPSMADRIESQLQQYISGDLTASDNLPPWRDDEANFEQVLGRSKLLNAEAVRVIKENWQRRYYLHSNPTPSPYGLEMPAKRLALSDSKLQIKRDGLDFTLTDFSFHNIELGVSAMIAWLEVNGCDDIDYRYEVGE